jgi:hypothetical protein
MKKRLIFLLSIAFLTVCCKQNDNKDNQQSDLAETSTTNPKRQKEIEDTKYFIKNEHENIVDNNGITQHYKVEKINLSKELKYDSKDIAYYKTICRVCSYTTIVRYKLTINGILYGEYDFPSYLINVIRMVAWITTTAGIIFCILQN